MYRLLLDQKVVFMKSVLDGNKGVYRGISYRWIADGDVVHLYITDHGKTILLDTGHYTQKRCQLPRPTANALEVGACKSSN
jgi:hypothetical protein